MEQKIQLSDHFGYKRLIRFTVPSILMMIVTSIYSVVDGFFISNFVGKTPFAAVNFIMPFLMILGVLGFMFGAGGSALIAKTMGEGRKEKANEIFSLLTYATLISGGVIAVLGLVFIRPIAIFLGAEGALLEDAIVYARINLAGLPLLMVQFAFTSFVVTAEKPKFGLWVTIICGVLNAIGDGLFMAVLQWGVVGAALATTLSQIVGGVIFLVYFARKNPTILRLGKAKWDGRAILHTCTNGSSELMSSISGSIVGMLYNAQLLKYAGENGVAAYGAIMYVNFIFIALFIGYSTGVAPVISFHYGADNKEELQSLRRKSRTIILVTSGAMLGLSELLAVPLAKTFVGYDAELFEMTVRAFRIYAFTFLFAGTSIFGSSFFTALNDGLTSALISFLRTLVFQIAAVMLMPLIWGIDGIWFSVVAAELTAVLVTMIFLTAKRKKYGY